MMSIGGDDLFSRVDGDVWMLNTNPDAEKEQEKDTEEKDDRIEEIQHLDDEKNQGDKEDESDIPDAINIHVTKYADKSPGLAFQIATLAKQVITQQKLKSISKLKHKTFFKVSGQKNPELNGQWAIVPKIDSSIKRKILNHIPMTRRIVNIHRPHVEVVKITNNLIQKLFGKHKISCSISEELMPIVYEEKFHPQAPLTDRIHQHPDPFTKLATCYIQTGELGKWFIPYPEIETHSSKQFKLTENNTLKLVPIVHQLTEKEKDENRRVLTAFVKFAMEEYGIDRIEDVEAAYEISFSRMIYEGKPLVPDLIHKVNICTHLNEKLHIQNLYDNLLHMQQNKDFDLTKRLSIREIRGLVRQIPSEKSGYPTLQECQAFIEKLLGKNPPRRIEDLDPKSHNCLINALTPTKKEWDWIYTGRKMEGYLSNKAFPTRGAQSRWDPVNAKQDLLEINKELRFPQISNQDCKKFWADKDFTKKDDYVLEKFAEVVSKKDPFTKDKELTKWRAGVLLPGAYNDKGEALNYSIDKVLEDHRGCMMMVMNPSCDNYRDKEMPLSTIICFRSTAIFSPLGGLTSLQADLATNGPRSIDDFKTARKYVLQEVANKAIRPWVGYLEYAKKLEEVKDKRSAFTQYLKGYKEYQAFLINPHSDICTGELSKNVEFANAHLILKEKQKELERIKNFANPANPEERDQQIQAIKNFLEYAADALKESLKYKKPSDIVLAGHSLGGVFVADALDVIIKAGYIPYPGFQFKALLLHSPKTSEEKNQFFYEYWRGHQEMLTAINKDRIPMYLLQRLQYGDVIPTSGNCFLGAGYDEKKDSSWLKAHLWLFDRVKTAKSIDVTDQPTHGTRITSGKEGVDWTMEELPMEYMLLFQNSYFLSGKSHQTFGLHWPVIDEIVREAGAILTAPAWDILRPLKLDVGHITRDENGVFFTVYKPPLER